MKYTIYKQNATNNFFALVWGDKPGTTVNVLVPATIDNTQEQEVTLDYTGDFVQTQAEFDSNFQATGIVFDETIA